MCKAMPYITVCEPDLERLFSAREDRNEGIGFQSILAHHFRQQTGGDVTLYAVCILLLLCTFRYDFFQLDISDTYAFDIRL